MVPMIFNHQRNPIIPACQPMLYRLVICLPAAGMVVPTRRKQAPNFQLGHRSNVVDGFLISIFLFQIKSLPHFQLSY